MSYKAGCAHLHTRACAQSVMVYALRIARRYRSRPSADQLMRDYGMSRATAYRWRAAWDYVYQCGAQEGLDAAERTLL